MSLVLSDTYSESPQPPRTPSITKENKTTRGPTLADKPLITLYTFFSIHFAQLEFDTCPYTRSNALFSCSSRIHIYTHRKTNQYARFMTKQAAAP